MNKGFFNIKSVVAAAVLMTGIASVTFLYNNKNSEVSAQTACVAPPSGMVSWWAGDGNANDIVDGNAGTLQNGATFAAGKVGQAFLFDGSDDFVSVPHSSNLDLTSGFTLDAWVYPAQNKHGDIMVKAYSPGGVGDFTYILFMRGDANRRLEGWIRTGGTYYSNYSSSSGSSLPLNQWSHVGMTWDGSVMRTYLNGQLDSTTSTSGALSTSMDPLSIGRRALGDPYGTAFPGLIDEAEVFSRALSQSEIAAIYNDGSAGKCKPQIVCGDGVVQGAEQCDDGNLTSGDGCSSSCTFTLEATACVAPPSGMVSWWDAKGNANDIIDGNHGTLQNGATFAAGKVGQAFLFDGVNDQVTVSDANNLDFINELTIDAWVFRDPTSGGLQVIAQKDALSGRSYSLVVGSPNPNQLGWFIVQPGGAYTLIQCPTELTTGAWHHVAGTYKFVTSGTSEMRLYQDGVLCASSNTAVGPIQVSTSPVEIGNRLNFGGDLPFKGKIDEVEFFSRALSQSEISAIVNAGSGGKCKPAAAVCGNNTLEGTEQCDDGNLTSGDGCSSSCTLEATACVAPPSGMVSWWPLDGNGLDVQDGNNVGASGLTFATGKVGQAGNFSGASAVSAPNAANLNFGTGDFTVDGWVNTTGASGVIASKTSASAGYILGVAGGGQAWCRVYPGSQIISGIVNDGNWHHVACTRENGLVTLYVDGFPAGSATITGNVNNTNSFYIGKDMNGLIDEVEVFSRALTSAQVRSIYQAGNFGKCKTPGVCGNTTIEVTEQCDDGNTTSGDGCSNSCQIEIPAVCGNNIVELNELCDDGNAVSGDGCSSTCQIEPSNFLAQNLSYDAVAKVVSDSGRLDLQGSVDLVIRRDNASGAVIGNQTVQTAATSPFTYNASLSIGSVSPFPSTLYISKLSKNAAGNPGEMRTFAIDTQFDSVTGETTPVGGVSSGGEATFTEGPSGAPVSASVVTCPSGGETTMEFILSTEQDVSYCGPLFCEILKNGQAVPTTRTVNSVHYITNAQTCVSGDGYELRSRDQNPPAITLVQITPNITSQNVVINKNITDASGVASEVVSIKNSSGTEVGTLNLSLTSGTAQNGTWSGIFTFPTLPDGTYTVVNTATDILGNYVVRTDGTVILDRTAPALAIISFVPSVAKSGTIVTVTVSASDVNGISSVTAEDVTAGIALVTLTYNTSTTLYEGALSAVLPQGGHSVRVTAYDNAVPTNPSTVTAAPAFIVDDTAPGTTITANPTDPSTSSSAGFRFIGADNVTSAEALTFECSLDGASFTACESPKNYTGLTQGSHNFRVRATDSVGNTDQTPASFTWNVNLDVDNDGILDVSDNCPTVFNPDQLNSDGDLAGDACDPNDDNDVISDVVEQALTGSPTGLTVNTSGVTGGLTATQDTQTNAVTFSGQQVSFTLPAGSTVPSGNLTVNYTILNGNSVMQIQGVNVPTPPGKQSVFISVNANANQMCIVDSSTGSSLTSQQGASGCSTNTAISQVRITCGTTATTQTFSGFPDAPTSRTYTCQKMVTGGQTYMVVSGLKFSSATEFADADDDGLSDAADACPNAAGLVEWQGCLIADKNIVTLHTVNLGGGASTKALLEGAEVRVFDRNNADFQFIAGSKNPDGSLYGVIYEADAGRVGSCTTGSDGVCYAGEASIGDYLVIVKYADSSTGKTVYIGRPKSPSDFVDSDGNGTPDLATKDFQIMKVFKKGVFQAYRGGSKLVVTGSMLEVIMPESAVWEGIQSIYPFIFTSDSDWTVDVCAEVPQGYFIVGIYDENGDFVSSGNSCIQALVANQTKIVAFEVREVGSPEPEFSATLKLKNPKGKMTEVTARVSDVRKSTFEANVKDAKAKMDGKKINGGKFRMMKVGASLWSIVRDLFGLEVSNRVLREAVESVARANDIAIPEWGINEGAYDASRLPWGFDLNIQSALDLMIRR